MNSDLDLTDIFRRNVNKLKTKVNEERRNAWDFRECSITWDGWDISSLEFSPVLDFISASFIASCGDVCVVLVRQKTLAPSTRNDVATIDCFSPSRMTGLLRATLQKIVECQTLHLIRSKKDKNRRMQLIDPLVQLLAKFHNWIIYV